MTAAPREPGDTPAIVKTRFGVRALFLGTRLDVRALELGERLSHTPVTVRAGGAGLAVLFRYGAVVLFDVAPIEQAGLIRQLEPFLSERFEHPEHEEAEIRISGHGQELCHNGVVHLREPDVGRLQVVADILAKSAVLSHYEEAIAKVFDRVEPWAAELEGRGKSAYHRRDLLRDIGGALRVQTDMVARVEVTEKPELVWDEPQLEHLYGRLQDEYELSERHAALERKLALVSRTAETMLELLHTERGLRLEWYIVILILVEIGLTLYQMILG